MNHDPATHKRSLRCDTFDCDLTIVGGGFAGTCCAITAAREGLRVTLIQDRPVLGGNASSEVRLWILGATSHLGNNNRWSREGGVVDEILVENLWRNPDGNPLIVDTILLEKVREEPNIKLLLNTAVFEVEKQTDDPDQIASVRGFCSQNSTMYQVRSPLFVDASGDGVLGFLAGAAFRMGAESEQEFGEKMAPSAEYGELLGHSIYFYTKDLGRPVSFTPPSYALKDITAVPRWRQFNATKQGCELWWIEYGGRLDTVHDTEAIKWELWRVVYGVWNHIKNSGQFPDAETKTLEWVGTIPGKRESRRFEGDHMLSQREIIEQTRFEDVVSFGGWAIDLHPADGVFSEKSGCNQYHSKGIYSIPLRSLYSRNVSNLFLGGRTMSATHVAFGSTRVMATCGHMAQAIGHAAAVCRRLGILPRDATEGEPLRQVQRNLLRSAQHLPHLRLSAALDADDLAQRATIEASSEFELAMLPAGDDWVELDKPQALLMPVRAGRMPMVTFDVLAEEDAEIPVELCICSRAETYTPDVVLERQTVSIASSFHAYAEAVDAGNGHAHAANGAAAVNTVIGNRFRARQPMQQLQLAFDTEVPRDAMVFVCLMAAPGVHVRLSDRRVTGVLALTQGKNGRVASSEPADVDALGIERFEFWLPKRRPGGKNFALKLDPPLRGFGAANVLNGIFRPTDTANAWVADLNDRQPTLTLRWDSPQEVRRIDLHFDNDFDHPLESVLMGHPERVVAFCVRQFRLIGTDASGTEHLLGGDEANHESQRTFVVNAMVPALVALRLEVAHPSSDVPAAVFGVRCYNDPEAGPVRRRITHL